MDFRITQKYESREKKESVSTQVSNPEVSEGGNLNSNNFVNLLNLIDDNQDLIQDCLAKQKDAVLPKRELKKYGFLALSTAALDCTNLKEYRSFAKKRLENMITRAIAEARLILELEGKICDNNEVGMEFASIEKTYC